MVNFVDGPAHGQILQFRRLPKYLRVASEPMDHQGTPVTRWDVLDSWDDTAQPKESLCVYVLASQQGTIHVDGVDENGRRRGQWMAIGSYEYLPADQQPADDVMRDNVKWQGWVADRVFQETGLFVCSSCGAIRYPLDPECINPNCHHQHVSI